MPFSVFIPCKYLSADFVISNAKFFHFSRKATAGRTAPDLKRKAYKVQGSGSAASGYSTHTTIAAASPASGQSHSGSGGYPARTASGRKRPASSGGSVRAGYATRPIPPRKRSEYYTAPCAKSRNTAYKTPASGQHRESPLQPQRLCSAAFSTTLDSLASWAFSSRSSLLSARS